MQIELIHLEDLVHLVEWILSSGKEKKVKNFITEKFQRLYNKSLLLGTLRTQVINNRLRCCIRYNF